MLIRRLHSSIQCVDDLLQELNQAQTILDDLDLPLIYAHNEFHIGTTFYSETTGKNCNISIYGLSIY